MEIKDGNSYGTTLMKINPAGARKHHYKFNINSPWTEASIGPVKDY